MDSLFEELVGIDSGRAYSFFLTNLQEAAAQQRVRDDELFYVASVLAHYSQTSRSDTVSMPPLANLSEVFDTFLLQTEMLNDPELLEFGGSQVLLFAGFFRDQMQRRHNLQWYDQVGQSLYEKAGQHSTDQKKRELFDRLSESFPEWTMSCCNLRRTLADNRFLLRMK